MGMFDTVRFENDIPDPGLRDREWQTKSLENTLTDYRISRGGELYAKRTETRHREDPDSWLGWRAEVIREWEEKVDFHGVIEAYTGVELEDGYRRWITYSAYFTYGKLTSFERAEELLPPPRPLPDLEDDSPRQVTATGELELDLPETIEVAHFAQEGRLYVLKLRYDGSLHAWKAGADLEIRGAIFGAPGEPTLRSTGRVRHLAGEELQLLASDTNRIGQGLFIIALRDYADDEAGGEL